MLLLACDINTLLILLNCWWIAFKIKLSANWGSCQQSERKREPSTVFETFRGIVLFPRKVCLWIVVVGSRNLLAIQNKHMLRRGRLKKSQFLRRPFLGSCCFENGLQLHIKPISSNSHQVFLPFREQIFSKQELAIWPFFCISSLWPWLSLPGSFWKPYLVSFIKQNSLKCQSQNLLPHFPEVRMFFLYFAKSIET